MCPVQSAICEFFSVTSEAWFLCNGVDLYYSITNPFSSFKSRRAYYHLFSWSVGLLFSLAPLLYQRSASFGFWYVVKDTDSMAVCWVKTQTLNSPIWFLFFAPIAFIYLVCLCSLYVAYSRLKRGISRTFLPRMRLLVTNTTNVICLLLYWFVVCVFYALTYFTQGNRLDNLLVFILASKGFSSLIVYILVIDVRLKLSHEKQEGIDDNVALREEVLNFATAGIRSSTRSAFNAKPEKAKISRRPKQGDNSHCSFTQ
jgi:hypothetical protein